MSKPYLKNSAMVKERGDSSLNKTSLLGSVRKSCIWGSFSGDAFRWNNGLSMGIEEKPGIWKHSIIKAGNTRKIKREDTISKFHVRNVEERAWYTTGNF